MNKPENVTIRRMSSEDLTAILEIENDSHAMAWPWEGFLGGTVSVTLLGTALWWATPFPYWLAAAMSAVIAVMAFAGSMTMSAIKRDRGVKDYGTLVEGHGGVLDRIDSICFAAPVFFHFTMYYLISIGAMRRIQWE